MIKFSRGLLGGHSHATRGKIVKCFSLLTIANIAIWALAIFMFRNYPVLLGTSFLAYGFGLRHAVDADHIAAIDNVTRKLMQQGQRPVGVGLFFSLGHSTIVFGLSAAVAVTAILIKNNFNSIESFGNIAGTLISACFLLAIAVMNVVVLISVFKTFHRVKAGGIYEDEDLNLLLAKRGFFARFFRSLFRLVERSWHMYPIGVLFGLGFDTATEVGLLGISATEASKGLPVWSIMIFPALFTAGMALIDSADSILMLGAYGWAFAKPLRKLYYNITITSVSILIAVIVGGIEILGLVQDRLNLSGPVWNPVVSLNNNFGMLGYLIIGIFGFSWIVSVLFYKFKGYDAIEVRIAD
jgi:nickel/cobalt transporter (NiCoT) family protein